VLGRIERLAERIDDYLVEPAFPSLLHGDLWTGNVLVRGDRIAGFVDPAIYCGHPEIELAFATLFGTFGEVFFEAYGTMKLEPGFHEEAIWPYPLLVHVRLFGWATRGSMRRRWRRSSRGRSDKEQARTAPGRSSLRNEPSSKGIAFNSGLRLAPPSYS
jgi:fructosamine-3-kinase